ncbi:L-serine ammonia-lyase, iron-sulfur-dependent, subunit alpha [Klebsiella aerogenes]|nr:L-serine ammonia-lyase, iron-sulfur-dependent, subunit alpha [Klebsiella aerogenes]
MISAFDIFKIGIGPSSSHTVGPMNAGKSFITELASSGDLTQTSRIVVDLYGSLSLTGKGHATDVAIIMGLAGNSPQDVDIDAIPAFIQQVAGQVQIPCIERNAINAVKAVNAARMALRRTSEPRVCLDNVIETMYETGKDMNDKYRETSRGGLAIKVICD